MKHKIGFSTKTMKIMMMKTMMTKMKITKTKTKVTTNYK